jgi:hypothetical protein
VLRRFPGSLVLAVLRAQAVLLQGIWFIQIAQILFKGARPHMHAPCRLPAGVPHAEYSIAAKA